LFSAELAKVSNEPISSCGGTVMRRDWRLRARLRYVRLRHQAAAGVPYLDSFLMRRKLIPPRVTA